MFKHTRRYSNMTLRVLQFFIPGREITLVGAVCQPGLNSILSPLAICKWEVCPATMEITAATGYEPLRGKSQRQAMRYVRNCDISEDDFLFRHSVFSGRLQGVGLGAI